VPTRFRAECTAWRHGGDADRVHHRVSSALQVACTDSCRREGCLRKELWNLRLRTVPEVALLCKPMNGAVKAMSIDASLPFLPAMRVAASPARAQAAACSKLVCCGFGKGHLWPGIYLKTKHFVRVVHIRAVPGSVSSRGFLDVRGPRPLPAHRRPQLGDPSLGR
jgi:hypothetical protein